MQQPTDIPPQLPPPAAPGPRPPRIASCGAVLAVLAVLFLIAGRLAGGRDDAETGPRVGLILAAAVLAGTAIPPLRRFLFRWLTSLPFAVALLAWILLATMLGTLVLQGVTPEEYARKYGAALAPLLVGLGLDDIFHSDWFVGWLALLAVSLVLVVIRKRAWRRLQWGHAMAHLGVVLILAGCFAGVRWGFKGHIDLHEGRSADAAASTARKGAPAKPQPLGFAVRLEKFDVEYYPPEPRFYVYERQGKSFRVRQSIKQKAAASWTAIGGSGAEFRVIREIPASRREAEAHVLAVRKDDAGPVEEIAVQPGGTVTTSDGAWRIRVLAYFPDFVIDSETRQATSRSPHPNNPALQVEVSPAAGGGAEKRWVFARIPEFDHRDERERKGPRLVYRHIPAEVPAQVEVEVQAGGEAGKHLFSVGGGTPLQLQDGRMVIDFEIKNEVKAYRSRLAVIEGERKVIEKTIEVNDPLSYGGYSFYQANYRKEDPTYSGIQVVRDPGLPFVWAGLAMLCAGVVYIYYVRPWMTRSKPA